MTKIDSDEVIKARMFQYATEGGSFKRYAIKVPIFQNPNPNLYP